MYKYSYFFNNNKQFYKNFQIFEKTRKNIGQF